MFHKKVKHEIGLTIVMAAFLMSWFGAALPALKATLVGIPMAYHNTLSISDPIDLDRDGIPNRFDKYPYGK